MRYRESGLLVFTVMAGFLCAATAADNPHSRKPRFVKFDVPGAGTGYGQGTIPIDINPAGEVTGTIIDANNALHGFVRDKRGEITVFDDPNAGTSSGQGTYSYAINAEGAVTGFYTDASGVNHGYVRSARGEITNFDAPDAGTGSGQGTFPLGQENINASGAVAGEYIDSNDNVHGFVRDSGGAFEEFDVPGELGTAAYAINAPGTTTGYYIDSNDILLGFVRSSKGQFTRFVVPGPIQGCGAEYINNAGWIIGWWWDANFVNHGFVRDPHGKITKFDPPGSGTGTGTIAWSINDQEVISGQYQDASGMVSRLRADC